MRTNPIARFKMSDDQQETDHLPFSDVLETIADEPSPTLQLEELVTAFGERGFGALFLFLGLLSIVIGWIPGSTTILGIPMLLLAIQLVFRRNKPWLPRSILSREIDRGHYAVGVAKVLPRLRVVERVARPRLQFMSTDLSEMLIGLAIVAMALILMLPLVGFNFIPSLIIAVFGFGMTQRDGLIMLVGWVGTAGFAAFCWLAWSVVMTAVHYSWGVAASLFGG